MHINHRILKWVMAIGGACVLALAACFIYNHQTEVKKTVKTSFMKSAHAYSIPKTKYVKKNLDAVELIMNEKKQRMLTSVIQAYRQEHPQIVKQSPIKQVEKNPVKSTTVKRETPVTHSNGPSDSHVVYLTIDDGPSESTAAIIKILSEYQVTATFFMLEPKMELYAADVKTLAKDGFGLGLHGVTHNKKLFYQSTASVVGEMKIDQDMLYKITGVKTNLIRVPYGSVPYMTKAYRDAEVQAGFIMWDWNVDSRDWDYKDQRYVTSTIQQLQKLKGKNESPVILIHDLPTTAKYLPQLLDYLKQNHYEFRKLDTTIPPLQFQPR